MHDFFFVHLYTKLSVCLMVIMQHVTWLQSDWRKQIWNCHVSKPMLEIAQCTPDPFPHRGWGLGIRPKFPSSIQWACAHPSSQLAKNLFISLHICFAHRNSKHKTHWTGLTTPTKHTWTILNLYHCSFVTSGLLLVSTFIDFLRFVCLVCS